MLQACIHCWIHAPVALQEVYTSKDVKKLLVQLQSDLMGVVDKVCTSLLQRRTIYQTNPCMHCLLEHVYASYTTGMLHLLLCQVTSRACTQEFTDAEDTINCCCACCAARLRRTAWWRIVMILCYKLAGAAHAS